MPTTPRRLRKPLPTAYPLAERFIDVDAMIEAGDPDAEVYLPGETWAELLIAAQDEQREHERASSRRWNESAMPGELATALPRVVQLEQEASERDQLRVSLAEAVGWGALNGAEDLLQVVRGYVMALDLEIEGPGARMNRERVEHWSEDQNAELKQLRAFRDAIRFKLQVPGCTLSEAELVDRAEELTELRAFKEADTKRRESVTFSSVPPELLVFFTHDAEKIPVEDSGKRCAFGRVRLLLESGEGCVLSFDDAREVARATLSKVDAALFPPAREPKKKEKKEKKEKCIWRDETSHTPEECGVRPKDASEALPAEPTASETAEKNDAEERAREVYCRSCRKWFPVGAHAPHKGKSPAQAELGQ